MSNSFAYFALAISILSAIFSQLVLKPRIALIGNMTNCYADWKAIVIIILLDPQIWLGVSFTIVGAVSWYYAMIRLPLSLMLPTAGVIAPIVSVCASFLYGESLSFAKITSILIITIGVMWLGVLNAYD